MIVACQREIEAKGIPTILITVLPDESRTMRPPRALHPVGHKLGRVLGQPGERDHQLRVLRAALAQLEERHQPGEIISFQP